MTHKILIMGLNGAGKTTFAKHLVVALKNKGKKVNFHDADEVRKEFDDWDFSDEGRHRQLERMKALANLDKKNDLVSVCCFICPKREYRKVFDADYVIWMNTVKSSKYENTNKIFEPPVDSYNYMITNFDYFEEHAKKIVESL